MPASQFTVYARYEQTTDSVAIRYLDAKTLATCKDVVVYHDQQCRSFFATFPWHYFKSKPTKRNRYVTLNCFRYRLVWL